MKKILPYYKGLLRSIPFLTTIPLLYFLILNNSFAISIAFVSNMILCGYRFYQIDKEQPNYMELFKKDTVEYRDRQEKAMVHLEKEIKKLREAYGKSTLEGINKKKFEFEF